MTRHVHQSGYPRTTGAQMRAALDVFADQHRADVITLTSIDQSLRDTIKAWAGERGWDRWHPRGPGGGYDGVVLARTKIIEGKVWRLTRLVLRTNRKAPIRLIAANVEGHGWFATWHAPAHNGGLQRGLWPTRVYLSALAGLRLARTRMGADPVIAADWNLDLARDKMRAFLTRPYRRMRFGWHRAQRATFGPRVIDGIMTNRKIARPSETLKLMDGFDHKPVLTVLGWL